MLSKDFTQEREFIAQLHTIKDYWVNIHKENAEAAINGFIHSLLVMFDGDSSLNDFHQIELTDLDTNKIINAGFPLHEILGEIRREKTTC